MNFNQKVVPITGSSSGIGRATTIRFAREGSQVVVNYNINKKGAEETRDEIENQGAKCLLIQPDVSRSKEVEMIFQSAVDLFKISCQSRNHPRHPHFFKE